MYFRLLKVSLLFFALLPLLACQSPTSGSISIVGTWQLTSYNIGSGEQQVSAPNSQTFVFSANGTFAVNETSSTGSTEGSGIWTQNGSSFTVVLQQTTGTTALGPGNFTLTSDGTLMHVIGGGYYSKFKRVN